MTNSKRAKPSTDTGTTETTTLATGEFVTQKGTEFEIATAHNGLFFVKMKKGGVAPAFCHEFFTSRQEAEKVLNTYLIKNDRISHLL